MIRIANLEIDPAILESFPESLAREECVLPLGLEEGAFRVAFGRREDYKDLIRKVRFIMDRRLFWSATDREALDRVIDEVYTYRATEVTNCPAWPRSECPRRWLALRPGEQPDVRFCEMCNRKVYLCANKEKADQYAGLARRIAIYEEPDNWRSVDS